MDSSLLVGTDFSGLGSPEEALKRLNVNHRIAFACERDKYARASYEANHKAEIFYDDVTTRDNKTAPYVDLYAFGFPCQAFSLAGHRKGFEDTRGTLFFNCLEYIRIHRPRVFIAENVKGLLSHDKVKGTKSPYGKTFGVIRDALAVTVNGQHNLYKYDDCVDYHVYFQVLNTKDYTVPQNRERIFIVGFRDEADAFKFKMPSKKPLLKRLKDLLQDTVEEKYFLSEKMISGLLQHVENSKEKGRGFKFKPIEDTVEEIASCIRANVHKQAPDDNYIAIKDNTKKGYAEAKLFDAINLSNPNSETRRGRIGNQIANTLDTACNQGVVVQVNPSTESGNVQPYQQNRVYDENNISPALSAEAAHTTNIFNGCRIRRLTPKECFRLQGYSDLFFKRCASVNSDTQLYKQAGNSITVDTIMYLLIQILKAINIPFNYSINV